MKGFFAGINDQETLHDLLHLKKLISLTGLASHGIAHSKCVCVCVSTGASHLCFPQTSTSLSLPMQKKQHYNAKKFYKTRTTNSGDDSGLTSKYVFNVARSGQLHRERERSEWAWGSRAGLEDQSSDPVWSDFPTTLSRCLVFFYPKATPLTIQGTV